MSVNTSSNAFRRVDVDQYSEDNFIDEESESSPGHNNNNNNNNDESLLEVERTVNAFLSGNKVLEALQVLLASSPVSSSDPLLPLLMRTLLSVKQAQVEGIVQSLDVDQRDVLMRYVYKGFEVPSEGSSGHLLTWHEKIFEASGIGAIVRVLTDRKQAQMRTLNP
uniref:Actin-related protein 2/3 complex subunit 5 n=1 Tax=Caligus rogercresseyi TaxID=217165 RepID=C1BML5_CALRO|nr:Actin-related protein 2/3 complex subunit 5 [Caligus rogercresseyi]